jgi:hypothetical protein
MVKVELSSEIALFGHVLQKWAPSFYGAWSLFLIHIQFTPSEALITDFL